MPTRQLTTHKNNFNTGINVSEGGLLTTPQKKTPMPNGKRAPWQKVEYDFGECSASKNVIPRDRENRRLEQNMDYEDKK